MRRRLVAAAIALLAGGCGGAPTAAPAPGVSGQLTVLAAASLTDAFHDEGPAFAKRYPGAEVTFSFGGSSTLAAQIEQGAPADVFASADQVNLDRVADQFAAPPRVFAGNRLEIAVAPGNPKHITSLADLSRRDLLVVLCAPAVPCGAYAAQALKKAGVNVQAQSQEPDVRSVLTKVATGEADAGVVYATDVRSSGGKVEGVPIPDADNVVAAYPVVTLKGGANPAAASAFVSFLTSATGESILGRHGFSKP